MLEKTGPVKPGSILHTALGYDLSAACASPGSKSSAGTTRLELQALELAPAEDSPVPVCTKDFRAV